MISLQLSMTEDEEEIAAKKDKKSLINIQLIIFATVTYIKQIYYIYVYKYKLVLV